jgi:hypothetical protein
MVDLRFASRDVPKRTIFRADFLDLQKGGGRWLGTGAAELRMGRKQLIAVIPLPIPERRKWPTSFHQASDGLRSEPAIGMTAACVARTATIGRLYPLSYDVRKLPLPSDRFANGGFS